MVNTQAATARILSFPATQHKPDLEASNLIRRIIDSKDNLLTALEVLRDSYNVILAGTSSRDADEILAQAEAALRQAHNVMANVEVTTTIIKNLQATSQTQLLLFPPSTRAGAHRTAAERAVQTPDSQAPGLASEGMVLPLPL